ncbi:putative integral membrane protein (TIGR00698 family) [Caldalkalibacillus uzonensis]|uniref:Integral membrane protein (TIGR00698 family) n=1 Tax=Caldalkalibacillus uzonensis TaxID=353224 RepID=A0ABU0CSF8_9BACI|nr:putative sulfate exporter family transporter [Caldalkalibacillus uzonensis]MDQ0337967.1 putative integral membrane protein (TIGR00698 family) [Caldalkalibacillus uzonensis]
MTFSYRILPGVVLCLLIMTVGELFSRWIGYGLNLLQGLTTDNPSPVSGIFIAILLGLVVRNVLGLHEFFRDGVLFSIRYILRLGIILLGIRLSFYDVVKLGIWGIPIIVSCVGVALFITLWMTHKMNQSSRLGTLIAVGTGICGVTAIVGTSPGIRANDREVAYAIANITLFGIIAMFIYPYVAYILFQNDPIKAGLFLGTAIHETAQVAGAALIYNQMFAQSLVIDAATITKLTRNFLLLAVVPLMSFYYVKKLKDRRESEGTETKWYQLIPLFVLGFLAMAIVRSIGDAGAAANGLAFGLLNENRWVTLWTTLSTLGSKYLLGIAMAGIGLSTSVHVFKGLGIKPFYIGMIAALTVSIISAVLIYFLGDFIRL